MYDQPAEEEEDDDTTPEYPLVLLRSTLDHADRVSADTQSVCDRIQPPLCTFQHVSLLAKIA